MNEKKYQAPKSQFIFLADEDLISTSGSIPSNGDLGEWDVEM